MANTLKFGNGQWATKYESTLAYNDENGNFKPLPFTFERRGNATRVNKEGLIEIVGENIPRIDYTDSTDGAMLLEPQRSNLNDYSENATEWDTINSTVSLTTESTSPSGQSSVYKVTDNDVDAQHRVDVRPTVTSGTEYTFSAFVKKPSGSDIDFVYLLFGGNFTTTRYFYNINEGTSLDSGGNIENYGNGWYRLSATATATSSGNGLFGVNLSNANNNNTYTGTGNGSMLVWGIQVEQGSYATSYIPTNGSAVTRLGESSSQTVPDGVIGQTEGVAYVEFNQKIINQNNTRRILALTDGTATNRIVFYITGLNKIEYYIRNSSGNLFLGTSSTDYGNSVGKHKIACAYKDGDYALYIDGNLIISGSGTSGTIPSCDRIDVGSQLGGNDLFEPINEVKLYNTRLTNSELQALTT